MTNKSRREILKLLSLAGFGLMVPACTSTESDELVMPPPKIPTNESDTLEIKEVLDILEEEIKSENVVFLRHEDADYQSYRRGFNLNHDQFPQVIALCKNTEGVSEAIKYANANGLKVAVKSGGHSFEGLSSNDGGLVINLSLMNRLEWQDDHQLVAEPAVLLRELYDFILPDNRLLPAGSCGMVGLGGLTLGGGYGFFSREYGLTCDHLLEAEFVDGQGNVIQVREKDELMWALKGGGNGNFGVVTRFVYKTQPLPTGFKRYRLQAYKLDKERAKVLMENWFNTSANLPNSAFSAFVLNGKTLTILITNFAEQNEKIDEMVTVLSDLMDKTSIGNRKPLKDALSTYYGTQHSIYFKNSSAGYYENYETISGCVDDILEVILNEKIIYQINTLGGNVALPEFEQESAYPHRHYPYLCELQSYWKKDKDKAQRLSAFKTVQGILSEHGISAQYRNYPNLDFPNWETAYYGEVNYKKLQKIKSKYDPLNTIQHKQSVTFAPENVEEEINL